MAFRKFPEGLFTLVDDWCSIEQIMQLLRNAKQRNDDVRISADTKNALIQENLRQAIESGAIPLEDVYQLIRDAEENGNQHIFYYRRTGTHPPVSTDEVGTKLWGANWAPKMNFPQVDLVENEFIYADLHPSNHHHKPHDWVLKIYGHEFAERPTDIVEEIGDNRFKREFVREARRIVIVVRWNNPGILEIRIPQTESKKRVRKWLELTWVMIAKVCNPAEFTKWNLSKARRKMIDEQQKHQKVYRCSTTRVLDGEHNVASFECHDPQGDLFLSQSVAESVEKLIGGGECTHLRVAWLQGKNPYPSRTLNTLLGHNEVNEVVIGGYCEPQDVDYVTDELRHFGR